MEWDGDPLVKRDWDTLVDGDALEEEALQGLGAEPVDVPKTGLHWTNLLFDVFCFKAFKR